MSELTAPAETMKVKPVRMPAAMIAQGNARAQAEGLRGGFSELVRIGIARVLADPEPLCASVPDEPLEGADPTAEELVATPGLVSEPAAVCLHPRKARKNLGYVTVCGDCRAPLNTRGR